MDVLHKLPEHIWTQIFQQLDKKSLAASTQTCKAWYDFIFGTKEILGKFTLRISSYDRKEKYFIERFGCNFKNVKICSSSNRRNSKKLNLSFRQTGSIMESIENVEYIFIDNVTFKFCQSPDYSIEFPHLKSMKLGDVLNGSKVFVAFQNVQLQELIFERYCHYAKIDNEFREWFFSQKQLKSIECFDEVARFVMTESSTLNFKLKKLKFNSLYLKAMEKLKDFFKSQDELEECEVQLNGSKFIDILIVKSSLDIKSLKKFKISSNYWFPIATTDLNADNSVETFIDDSSFANLDITFLELLPKLKHYQFTKAKSFCSTLSKLSINCHMLEDLQICEKFDCNMRYASFSPDVPSIKFIYLKEMELTNIYVNDSSNFWMTLTSGSQLIEKLSLHFFNLDEKSLNYMCKNWRHFKTLALGCGLYSQGLRDILGKSESFSTLIISSTTFSQFNFEHAEYEVKVEINITLNLYPRFFYQYYVPALRSPDLYDNICDFEFNVDSNTILLLF